MFERMKVFILHFLGAGEVPRHERPLFVDCNKGFRNQLHSCRQSMQANHGLFVTQLRYGSQNKILEEDQCVICILLQVFFVSVTEHAGMTSL